MNNDLFKVKVSTRTICIYKRRSTTVTSSADYFTKIAGTMVYMCTEANKKALTSKFSAKLLKLAKREHNNACLN